MAFPLHSLGFLDSCPARVKMWHLTQGENQQWVLNWLLFLFSLCPRILASQVLVVLAGLNSNFSFPSPRRFQSLFPCLPLSKGLCLLLHNFSDSDFWSRTGICCQRSSSMKNVKLPSVSFLPRGPDPSSPACPQNSQTTSIRGVSHPSFLVLGKLDCFVTSSSVIAASRGSHWLDTGWY